ncbi:MAG TPA: hypothetical protein VGI85_13565 [Chthoniobacterales bacterium]
MLTISAFLLVTSSVLTSVWWACKDETVNAPGHGSDTISAL